MNNKLIYDALLVNTKRQIESELEILRVWDTDYREPCEVVKALEGALFYIEYKLNKVEARPDEG